MKFLVEIIGSDVFNNPGVHGALKALVCLGSLAVSTGTLARIFSSAELLLHSLIHCRQEDHFTVCGLGHGLHCFQVSDLHGRGGGEDIGGLTTVLGYAPLWFKRDDDIPDASTWPIRLQREQQ